MTTAPTPDLLPCPFCGGPASAHEVNPKEAPGWVRLTVAHTPDCFSRAPKETLLLSAADLERWNRRAELEARKPLAKHALRKVLNETAANIDSPNIVMTHWELVARSTERAHGITGGSP